MRPQAYYLDIALSFLSSTHEAKREADMCHSVATVLYPHNVCVPIRIIIIQRRHHNEYNKSKEEVTVQKATMLLLFFLLPSIAAATKKKLLHSVSIRGPLGYEPNTLPLRHGAVTFARKRLQT